MKTTLEKLEKSRVRLTVELDAQEFEEGLAKAYTKVVKNVSVPGFRKGRVPRPILERTYGEQILYEDAIDYLLPKAYQAGVEETGINPVDQPDVDIEKIDRNEGIVFKLEVDVYPTVELGEYKEIEAEKEIEVIEDEDVEGVLKSLQERHSELVVVDSRNDVQKGDFVVFDFKGYIDDQPFQGGAAEDYTLEVGSGQFIPGFEDQLIGMKLDEEGEVKVTFPEDYHAEQLAGKEAVFKVKIKSLKEKMIPELDDDFAKDVSEHETLDELKAEIKKDLEEQATRRTKNKLENTLLEKIISNSSIEVPEAMIQRRIDALMQDFAHRVLHLGLTIDQYLDMTQQNKEQIRENFREEAERLIKADLVLEEIVEKEGITIEDEEIDSKIEEMVEGHPDPEAATEQWQVHRESIRLSLEKEKALQLIVNSAVVTEKVLEKTTEEATAEATAEHEG